ncbi:lipoprotein N-acyltransferase Lnb domain-containing protein [Sunxiuqinia sp. A32]|uniref:lipoprotein N-acyltransferase Lnb domain-containing protein n=1 Tax=Sunxiuqinia sp. A32 TaxID=3461496 RepID=UPI0040458AE1
MKQIFYLFIAIFLFSLPQKGFSVQLSEDAEISVLTCGKSELIHAIYGHTAIRVNDQRRRFDVVFNYGVFNFSAPNFVYRFAKGRTDYLLAPERYSDFYEGYKKRGRSITEQVLNLNHSEKQRLLDFLIENAQPENREYRYNFFYDNCATRVRDVIENQIDGTIIFPKDSGQNLTFRKLVTAYQKILPWTNFGIQLTLGTPADKIASTYEEMFLPDYLMKHFADAKIRMGDETKPLVKETNLIYEVSDKKKGGINLLSPFVVLSICLLIVFYYTYRQLSQQEINFLLDYILLFVTGLIGLVTLWFVTFSEHPAMHPNYNMWWAVPTNLFFMGFWLVKKWRPLLKWYWQALSVWLILFFAFNYMIPQAFHIGFYLIALMMLTRSLFQSFRLFREKRQ